jgi:DNA polymerase III sliding clamp (beta) subunit (PCNA family)
MAAVRRVSLVAERTSPVRLTFGHGEVVIEAHTDGRARAAESVRAAFTGTEPVISFNPGYLLDGLAAAAICGAARPAPEGGAADPPEPGRVRLEFTSPAKPALITWAGYDTAPMDSDEAAGAVIADGDGPASAGDTDASETDPGETDTGTADESGDIEPGADQDSMPAFRYLVVPLRSPSGPGATS